MQRGIHLIWTVRFTNVSRVQLQLRLLTTEEEMEVTASPLTMLVAYMKCMELGKGLLGVRLEPTSTDVLLRLLRSKLLEQGAGMALGL